VKLDSLTRRSEDLPKEGDERLLHQSQTILKKGNLDPAIRKEVRFTLPAELGHEASEKERNKTEPDRDNVAINVTTRQQTQRIRQDASTASRSTPDLPKPEPAEVSTSESSSEPLPESELRVLQMPLQIEALMEEAYKTDPVPSSILQALKDGDERYPNITLAECEERGTYLYYRDCL
jgi:hypothetical protein